MTKTRYMPLHTHNPACHCDPNPYLRLGFPSVISSPFRLPQPPLKLLFSLLFPFHSKPPPALLAHPVVILITSVISVSLLSIG